MSKQGYVRHCNSVTSLFFERSKDDKAFRQASKKPREETKDAVFVVNSPEETAAIITKRKR